MEHEDDDDLVRSCLDIVMNDDDEGKDVLQILNDNDPWPL